MAARLQRIRITLFAETHHASSHAEAAERDEQAEEQHEQRHDIDRYGEDQAGKTSNVVPEQQAAEENACRGPGEQMLDEEADENAVDGKHNSLHRYVDPGTEVTGNRDCAKGRPQIVLWPNVLWPRRTRK